MEIGSLAKIPYFRKNHSSSSFLSPKSTAFNLSSMQNLSTEVLIIGAGPAGTIAAAQLLQLGRKVTILEKQKFPRFVIGESLLPRCMDHLSDLLLIGVELKVNAVDLFFKLDFLFR